MAPLVRGPESLDTDTVVVDGVHTTIAAAFTMAAADTSEVNASAAHKDAA